MLVRGKLKVEKNELYKFVFVGFSQWDDNCYRLTLNVESFIVTDFLSLDPFSDKKRYFLYSLIGEFDEFEINDASLKALIGKQGHCTLKYSKDGKYINVDEYKIMLNDDD